MRFTKEANTQFVELIDQMILETGNVKEVFEEIYHKKFNELLISRNIEEINNVDKLQKKFFKNRYEFGKYIYEVLEKLNFGDIVYDECLWNYISCFYLEYFISNSKAVNRYKFINTFFDLKRLLARTPWFLYSLAKENSLFSLCNPLNIHSNMCEQFVSRQELVRNKSVSELCQSLYYDESSHKLKPNAAKHEKDKDGKFQKGCLYPRLTKTVGKLNKIYDLWSIEEEDLSDLIGQEFEIWK